MIAEIVIEKDFPESDTENETFESIKELNYPQEYEDRGIFILYDIIEKKWRILEYKRYLNDLDMIIYLFS